MTTRAALQPGTMLEDRYEILTVLRAGGMGALYQARDTRLADSLCAVKEMLPQHDGSHNADYIRRRFIEEMKVLVRLNHADIPRVRDYFVIDGLNYIVMDLVEGSNLLDQMLEHDQPMSGPEAVRLGVAILSILEYLHGHTPPTVHRDIKPANILIEKATGRFKLVDFGLACETSGGATVHTQVGTLGYCPLEQIQGKAEPRSDLYALGATLHHLLTMEPPVPLQIRPLKDIRPDLPPALSEVLSRSLNPKVAGRFPDAASFRRALEAIDFTTPAANDEATGLLVSRSLTSLDGYQAGPPQPVRSDQAAPEQARTSPETIVVQRPPDPPWVWPLVGVLAVGVTLLVGFLMFGPRRSEPVAGQPSPVAASPSPAAERSPVALATRPAPPPPPARKSPPPRAVQPVTARPTPKPKPQPQPVATRPGHTPSLGGQSYPTYPKAHTNGQPTPPPAPPPTAPTPPPQAQQPPPTQPRPLPPRPEDISQNPNDYERIPYKDGQLGPQGEPWPYFPDGRPYYSLRLKGTQVVFPSSDGELPLLPPGVGRGQGMPRGPQNQGMPGGSQIQGMPPGGNSGGGGIPGY